MASGLTRSQGWLVGILALGSACLTLALPLNEFDPILHFALKGKLLHGGVLPTDGAFQALTGEYGRIMTHPNYPLGIPILEASAAHFGGWSERWVQWPLALWSASLPGAVALGLRAVSSAAAPRGAVVAACTPALYVVEFLHRGWRNLEDAGLGAEKMLGGRGDLPLAALLACAIALLMHARRQPSLALLAGLALGGAGQIKNEGLGLIAVVLTAGVLAGGLTTRPRGPSWRILGLLAVATLLALAPWLHLRGQLPAIDENYPDQFTSANLVQNWTEPEAVELAPISPHLYGPDWTERSHLRPVRISRWFLNEFFGVDPDLPFLGAGLLSWGLLWLLFFLGLGRALRESSGRWVALFVLGGMALYALVLLVSPWFLTALHQKQIPGRLLLHLIGPAAMVAAWPRITRPSPSN